MASDNQAIKPSQPSPSRRPFPSPSHSSAHSALQAYTYPPKQSAATLLRKKNIYHQTLTTGKRKEKPKKRKTYLAKALANAFLQLTFCAPTKLSTVTAIARSTSCEVQYSDRRILQKASLMRMMASRWRTCGLELSQLAYLPLMDTCDASEGYLR